MLVGIGFIGIFVPLLPTTDFMILAVPCFARSSPRLEAWIVNHPRFGPGVLAWRRERAIPRHAKIAACVGMTVGFVLFYVSVRPRLSFACAIAIILIIAGAWIIRRPAPGSQDLGSTDV